MNNPLFRRVGVMLALTFCLFPALAAGQICPGGSGCLDTSFGNGGVSTLPVFGGGPGDGTVQSDGKALVLMASNGSVSVVRFNFHGGPDLTFGGGDGVATLSWTAAGGNYGTPHGLATQMDDGVEKILVAGWTYIQDGRKIVIGSRVDRLMPDGTVDTTFGTGGSFIRKTAYATSIAVQPWDQRIVTAGAEPLNVTRLLPDGGLDMSFGAGGVVNTTNIVSPSTVAIQSDGKIVVAGALAGKGQKVHMTAARFSSSGSLDSGFGSSGRVTIDFATNSRAFNIGLAADGKIVLAGTSGELSNVNFATARLTSSGQLDISFSADGKAIHDFSGLSDHARGVGLRVDGRILVVGDTDTLPSHRRNIAILGYSADGSPDALFGANGVVATNVTGQSEHGRKIFFQNDPMCVCEKLLVVGMMNTPTGAHAVVARYLP